MIAGLQIHAADAQIADVADQQAPLRIERDAVRLPQLRLGGGPAIAAKAGGCLYRPRW